MVEQPDASTDERAERGCVDPTGGWHLEVARFLGWATAWATTEAQTIASRTMGSARSSFESTATDATKARQLVRELAEMVAAQADEGYEALEDMTDFWRLVRQLYEGRFRTTQARRTAHERRNAGARASRADVIDVEVAESEKSRQAGGSGDGPDDVTLEPDLEGAEDSVQGKSRRRKRETREEDSE